MVNHIFQWHLINSFLFKILNWNNSLASDSFAEKCITKKCCLTLLYILKVGLNLEKIEQQLYNACDSCSAIATVIMRPTTHFCCICWTPKLVELNFKIRAYFKSRQSSFNIYLFSTEWVVVMTSPHSFGHHSLPIIMASDSDLMVSCSHMIIIFDTPCCFLTTNTHGEICRKLEVPVTCSPCLTMCVVLT